MNYFNVSLFLGGAVGLFSAIMVFTRNKNLVHNRAWFWLNIFTVIWSFGYFMMITTNDYTTALYSNWILHFAASFIPSFFLFFVVSFVDALKSYKFQLITSFVLSFIFVLLTPSQLFVRDVIPKHIFSYVCDAGPLYKYFTIFFFVIVAYSLFILIKNLSNTKGIFSNQLKYILIFSLLGFSGGGSVFFMTFNVNFPPYPIIFFSLYPLVVTYAITRYRLFNIKYFLSRSILFTAIVLTVASFFSFSVIIVGNYIGDNTHSSQFIIYLITSFLVVIFLDPLKSILAKITDKIFYKDKVNYQDILQHAGNIIAKELDLRILSEKLSALLTNKLKIKQVDVFDSDFKKLAYSGDRSIDIGEDIRGFLSGHAETIVVEELVREVGGLKKHDKNFKAINDIIDNLQSLDIEMIVPIVDEEKQIAYLLLSEKHSGDLYNEDDINFFQVLVPQIASAVEKSQLYEEVQKFNVKLQKQVDQRTKSLQEANKALEDRNKFLTTMQVVNNMISRTLDLKKITQMIVDSIAIELGYVGGILSFVDEDRKYLKVNAITETKETKVILQTLPQDPKSYEAELKSGYSLGVDTVLTGQKIYSDSLAKFLCPPADNEIIDVVQEALEIKTVVGMPIFSEDKTIGIIHFLLPFEENKISSLDVETMTALTDQVGILYRNLQLYDNLQSTNKELQEANVHLRALDKAKSEFVSIASHQLRTPISAIKGYLSMLLDGDFGKIDPAVKKVISGIFESSSRLARLVNIFLNVSRIESGRLKLDIKPLQINDLINSVIDELSNEAKQKGLALTYGQSAEKLPLVAADSDKLREVILNLIDNSIKYTPEGSVDVSVDVDSDKLTFMVKDTGIGIDPEEAKGLFRKFVRGSGVSQIHTGGSGLGLFIAQRIINEHQGKIWAESKGKEKGSAFKFEIPLYKEN